jgi:hypothetical protein
MHRRVHAARVGVLAGEAQLIDVIKIGKIEGSVETLDGHAGGGDELVCALGHLV